MYDSLRSAHHAASVALEMRKLSELIPTNLTIFYFYKKIGIDFTLHPEYIDREEESSLNVVFMDNLPQQSPGSLDYGVFIVAYVKYLSHGKGIPPGYFDAEAFCTRYAALLCQYGTQKNEIVAVSDDEYPDRLVRPLFDCESSDVIIIP
ncbi:hypothetical protein FXO38_03918 [Capsicum annuum]|nr:hypothetical protein FXO38_03918 [Capsicum annuum]